MYTPRFSGYGMQHGLSQKKRVVTTIIHPFLPETCHALHF